ncbi:MAG: hypothetical protein M1831_003164 [Alyxoria varia]|nr:MAG: hypothetical protein M1831_003164 [Alyxoria varia]
MDEQPFAKLYSYEIIKKTVFMLYSRPCGRVVIFTELIGRTPEPTENATQALILAHRRELVEQAARHCSSRYPKKSVDIEMGNLKASGLADITIASVQSINSGDRILKYDPQRFKLVLVDEAHHIVAAGYRKILQHFGLLQDVIHTTPALVGVSATFSRFDGLALGKVIDHIVYHKDYVEMINDKWLSDVIFTTVQSKANLSEVKKSPSGDFLPGSLSEAVNTDETNLTTVRSWLAKAGDRKSTLGFAVDIAHVESLCSTFRRHGIDARYVTGVTPNIQRAETIDAFRQQKFPVLLNCGVFTEGTDIPNIDCILLARPTRSTNLLVQMIGRGMRLHTGKESCHVIDMVGSLERGIVTTPTLFGLDPDEILEGADVDKINKMRERKQQTKPQLEEPIHDSLAKIDSSGLGSTVKFTDYDSVTDLLSDTAQERHIRAISKLSWVPVGKDKYVLTNGSSGSYLTLEKLQEEDLFHVKLVATIPGRGQKRPTYFRPREVARSETFESAVRAADTYAREHFVTAFVLLHVKWRQAAASQAQVDFLNRFRSSEGEDSLEPGDITKGKAGDMITKLRFGARGMMKEINKIKAKLERERQRQHDAEDLRNRQTVRVGPVRDRS